ncbi:MAG: hypothetical protein ACRDAX_05965 [Propionibacteriaceae bacterium]
MTDSFFPQLQPLAAGDPARLGDFWLDARLLERPSGIAYTGHGDNETSVVLILLSQGAAADAAARDRFAGSVNKLHIDTVIARGGHGQHEGRLGHKFRSEDDDPVEPDDMPLAPWVALANDYSLEAIAEADRILSDVDLSKTPLLGKVSGPDYDLHWKDQNRPGFSRIWPLPWPGRYDRAGWSTIIISWLLMLLMALLAVITVIVLFQKSPEQPPPPPVPTTATTPPPPESASPSPQSGSPSPQSGSPSPESGSPSPQSGSPSPQSGSPSPSTGGSPSPNSKL